MPTWDDVMKLASSVDLGQLMFWAVLTGLVLVGAKKAYPSLRAFIAVIDAIATLPDRLAALGTTLVAQGEELEKVRSQVQNSHDTNLRDELDARHKETIDRFSGLAKDIGRLDSRDVLHVQHNATINKKLDDHLQWAAGQEDRIDALERKENPLD